MGIALFVLVVILSLIKWGRGFVANVAVLLGIVSGAVIAAALGLMNLRKSVVQLGSTSCCRFISEYRSFT